MYKKSKNLFMRLEGIGDSKINEVGYQQFAD
jgi:hypothetical protein